MIGMVMAAALAAAAPGAQANRPAPDAAEPSRPEAVRKTPPASTEAPARRRTLRRRLAAPDLSPPTDPYLGSSPVPPRQGDPQHPSLAATPDEVGAPGRVSPVPIDPWAPVVPPIAPPPAVDLRPPDAAG
jgi:hypothetical protein